MDRIRALFSMQHLPKLILFVAIYLLGRMEGEGRFTWGEVFSSVWKTTVTVSSAAAASARDVTGL